MIWGIFRKIQKGPFDPQVRLKWAPNKHSIPGAGNSVKVVMSNLKYFHMSPSRWYQGFCMLQNDGHEWGAQWSCWSLEPMSPCCFVCCPLFFVLGPVLAARVLSCKFRWTGRTLHMHAKWSHTLNTQSLHNLPKSSFGKLLLIRPIRRPLFGGSKK